MKTPPPTLPDSLLRELAQEALELRSMAPWEILYDSDLIGLRDAKDDTVSLVSVLGNASEVFGLVIYHGKYGVRWLLKSISGDTPVEFNQDMAMEQQAYKLEFVRAAELLNSEKTNLKRIKFKAPRGGEAPGWPQFQSLEPGYFPWPLSEPQARQVLGHLQRLNAFFRLVISDLSILDREGIPFLPTDPVASGTQLCVDQLEWMELQVPPEPACPITPTSEETRTALAALPVRGGLVVEAGSSWMHMPVDQAPKPLFPRALILADVRTGAVLGIEMEQLPALELRYDLALRQFEQMLLKLKSVPGEVRVDDPLFAAALEPLGLALGFHVRTLDGLPQLESILQFLEHQFS